MRRPNLASGADLARLLQKARVLVRPARSVLPRLRTYSPPAIPLPGSGWARAINEQLYRATIQRELHRAGMSTSPLIWVYGPHVAPLIRGLPRQFLLYHCVDKWSAFEGYDPGHMEACEAEICREADLVLASAEDLADRCRAHSSNVHYVPHGVDHAHFRQALQPGPLPDDLASIPEPRIGFFGLIHEWVDIELIGALADVLPYHFVLIGAGNQRPERFGFASQCPCTGTQALFAVARLQPRILRCNRAPSAQRTNAIRQPDQVAGIRRGWAADRINRTARSSAVRGHRSMCGHHGRVARCVASCGRRRSVARRGAPRSRRGCLAKTGRPCASGLRP